MTIQDDMHRFAAQIALWNPSYGPCHRPWPARRRPCKRFVGQISAICLSSSWSCPTGVLPTRNGRQTHTCSLALKILYAYAIEVAEQRQPLVGRPRISANPFDDTCLRQYTRFARQRNDSRWRCKCGRRGCPPCVRCECRILGAWPQWRQHLMDQAADRESAVIACETLGLPLRTRDLAIMIPNGLPSAWQAASSCIGGNAHLHVRHI